VFGIDRGGDRLKFVQELGAPYVVDAKDAEKYINDKFGGVSATVCYSPSIQGYATAFKITRMAGVVVAVGEPPEGEGYLPVTPATIIDKGIEVIPNSVGSPLDIKQLFSLYVDKKIRSFVTEVAPAEDLNDIFQKLDNGKIIGRAVIEWRSQNPSHPLRHRS
jgi:propanol-preferring alcohol dehydrogenase